MAATERQRQWRLKNIEHVRAYFRDVQRLRRVGKDEEALAYSKILLGDPCSYCGGPTKTVDHIVASKKGGSNRWFNLTSACFRCNSEKKTKPLLRFLWERSVYGQEAQTA